MVRHTGHCDIRTRSASALTSLGYEPVVSAYTGQRPVRKGCLLKIIPYRDKGRWWCCRFGTPGIGAYATPGKFFLPAGIFTGQERPVPVLRWHGNQASGRFCCACSFWHVACSVELQRCLSMAAASLPRIWSSKRTLVYTDPPTQPEPIQFNSGTTSHGNKHRKHSAVGR